MCSGDGVGSVALHPLNVRGIRVGAEGALGISAIGAICFWTV